MEWQHSLYITYNEKQYIIDHVDPDKYNYLELVSDLYECVLRDIPTNLTCIFTVRCRIPPTTQFMEVNTDKDVLEMFNMYRGQVGIHLEVVNVEKAEALSQEKPYKPKSTTENEAEAETEVRTVKCSNCKELGHNIRGCQRAPIKQKGKVTKDATSSQPTTTTQESPRIPKTRSQSKTHENSADCSTAQEIAMAQYKVKRAKRLAKEEA